MANMTIENIGSFLQSGNLEQISSGGRTVQPQAAEVPGAGPAGAGEKSFTQMLGESLDKVNEMQVQGDRASAELAAGRNKNIHETMLLLEKADMSFRLMMQVRNKLIDAYKEVMRMQV